MLKIRLLACGAALCAIQVAAMPAATAATNAFSGTWTSTDTDGSHQRLDVRGSGAHAVSLYDDAAGVCGGAPARIPGTGAVSGELLTMTGVLVCTPGGTPLGRVAIEFNYDSSSDTLTDQFGVTWHRA
jgi:hypothetical protein